jgi:hypothetical protein
MKSDKNEGDSGAFLTRLASGAFGMLEAENVDSSSFFCPGTIQSSSSETCWLERH